MARDTKNCQLLRRGSRGREITRKLFNLVNIVLGPLLLSAVILLLPQHTLALQALLTGCNNSSQVPLYVSNFVCSSTAYGTGSISGWNELDLVPFQLKTTSVTGDPGAFTLDIILDNQNTDGPAYDFISLPVPNSGSCQVSASPSTGNGAIATPGLNGVAQSIYRTLTITQTPGTTCVFDFYGRLALGSSQTNSPLHADIGTGVPPTCTNPACSDVSIPVSSIKAQSLSKSMTAQTAADYTWTLAKNSNPTMLHLGDVCAPANVGNPVSAKVSVEIDWTKNPATSGVSIATTVSATNPAARAITVNTSDIIYKGLTQTNSVDSTGPVSVSVPANSTIAVLTHTTTDSDTSQTNYNDVATATYTDNDTNAAIAGNTTASTSAAVQTGAGTTNATADVTDSESISGTGLSFSVDSFTPSIGEITSPSGYTPTTPTTSTINWDACNPANSFCLNASASPGVTFSKTITVSAGTVTSGTLSDTATLKGSNGFTTTAQSSISIDSTATGAITINTTLPTSLNAGQTVNMVFAIAGTGSNSTTASLKIDGPYTAGTTKTVTIANLSPDSYQVSEQSCQFIQGSNPPVPCNLVANPTSVPIDLTIKNNLATCIGTANFTNNVVSRPTAAVTKSVDCTNNGGSTTDFAFTLTGGNCNETQPASNSQGASFACGLQDNTTYTIVENTPPSGWSFSSVTDPSGNKSTTNSCQFTVHLATDGNKTFTCSFSNVRQREIDLTKTLNGSGNFNGSFDFDLRTGASAGNAGKISQTGSVSGNANTLKFTGLSPNSSYQVCETVPVDFKPAFTVNGTPTTFFVPTPDINCVAIPISAINSCAPVSVSINNTTPKGEPRSTGYWKNWSCEATGNQTDVLDHVLATFPGGGFLVGKLFLNSCNPAVNLLSKSTLNGTKETSEPLFNLAAQFIGAKLNIQANAISCTQVVTTISNAQTLLVKYNFNGNYPYSPKLNSADAIKALAYAVILDAYSNDVLPGCQ